MARTLGRYELLRPLARGGMAEVYLARRRAAGVEKWLVVKRMRPETSGDPRFLDLFVREARLSMSLVHQNIVPVFDFGRIDEQVFLAMERVEGRDLGSSLARGTNHRLPPLLAAFIAAECCQALDYAHQRKAPDGVALGIVHRDVTPRNVLLSWSGEVKLTDFGIAAMAGDATSRLIGTPQYMAPEQARSEPIDPRADIYAIGVVLREALTGVRPRPGTDRETILDAARRGELIAWPDAGDLPPALVAIVERATAAAAADRYPDARSMLEDLDSFIVAERAAHKAESPARQLAAWLAVVWEGARDDAAADATIEAGHLVSFLDDGAHDVLGTGTARSLAATAADDVPAGPPPPAVTGARGPRSAMPLVRAADGARGSRISSSQSQVASGSFHALPASGKRGSSGGRSRPRQIAPLMSIVVVAVVVGATVFVATNSYRDRAEITAQAEPVTVRLQDPAPAVIEHRIAVADHADGPGSGPPVAVQVPAVPKLRPRPGVVLHHPEAGSGSGAAIDEPAPAPRTCKVRINLTPWAYYTADDDPTRHETPGTIELTPGTHRLHVWNPELKVERDLTLEVPADRETMNYSAPLQPPAPVDP
jgi:tRNA A-37 threonylcarbamoyl transferase component Bud32